MGTIWLPRITQHLLALTAIITLLAVVPARANAQDDGQEPHITVEISQVDYLKDVHSSDDWTPEAEAKAVIVTQRTCKGRQAAMKLPATGYVSLLPEQSTTEFAGQSMGVCVDDTMNELYFQLVLIDEDAIDPSNDRALNAVLTGFVDLLGVRIKNPFFAIPANVLFTDAAQQALDYLGTADTMGEAIVHVTRSEGWRADGRPHTIMSSNGTVRFTYRVRVADSLGSPKTTPSITGESRRLDRDANLRSGPGKAYAIIRALRAGTIVELTGATDNGWAEVYSNEDQGWVYGEFLQAP